MQGEGGSFVLDDKAASAGRKRCKLWPYAVKGGLAGAVMDAVEGTVSTAPVDAVHSGRGATPRPEQTIEFGERTTADQCESPLALSRKPRDQYRQLARNMDEFRTRGDLEQGAVNIEEQRRLQIERRRWSRFARRQKSVFVRCTFSGCGVSAKHLICPGFPNHAKAF